MAATFRIELVDANPGGSSGQGASASGSTSSQPSYAAPAGAFDPEAAAHARVEREERARRVEAHYKNITEGPADAIDPERGQGQAGAPWEQVLNAVGVGRAAKLVGQFGGIGGGVAGAAAEGAGAAGAAGIGAAAAGGPAALMISAAIEIEHMVEEQIKKFAQALDTTRQGIELTGHIFADFARNDYMSAAGRAADAAAEGLKKIPVVGEVLSSSFQLAVAPVRAFTEVVGAFVDRGQQLARYSGAITEQRSIADVRSILADIKEADVLGADIARLTDAQSRIWDELRSLMLPIKYFLVNVLANHLENIARGTERLGDSVRAQYDFQIRALELLGQMPGMTAAAAVVIEELKKIRNALVKQEPHALVDQLYAIGDPRNTPVIGQRRDPLRNAAAANLVIPAAFAAGL